MKELLKCQLLDKDNSFTVHHFNFQSLAIEMFKVINNIAAIIIDNSFTTYHSYNLRSKAKFVVPVCVQFITVKILYKIQSPYLEYDTKLHKRF